MTEAAAGGGAVDIGHTVADAPLGPTQTLPPHDAGATTSSTNTKLWCNTLHPKYRKTSHNRPDLLQKCERCNKTTEMGGTFVHRKDRVCIDCDLRCPVCGATEQSQKGTRGHSSHSWTADSSLSGKGRGRDFIPSSLRRASWEGRKPDAICDQCLAERVCKRCGCSVAQGAIYCRRHQDRDSTEITLSDLGHCTHCVADRSAKRRALPSEREQREQRLRRWRRDVAGATRLVVPAPTLSETERHTWRYLRKAAVFLLQHMDAGVVYWGPTKYGLTTYADFMDKLSLKCLLSNNPYGLPPKECAARMVSALIKQNATTAGQRRRLEPGVKLVALPW